MGDRLPRGRHATSKQPPQPGREKERYETASTTSCRRSEPPSCLDGWLRAACTTTKSDPIRRATYRMLATFPDDGDEVENRREPRPEGYNQALRSSTPENKPLEKDVDRFERGLAAERHIDRWVLHGPQQEPPAVDLAWWFRSRQAVNRRAAPVPPRRTRLTAGRRPQTRQDTYTFVVRTAQEEDPTACGWRRAPQPRGSWSEAVGPRVGPRPRAQLSRLGQTSRVLAQPHASPERQTGAGDEAGKRARRSSRRGGRCRGHRQRQESG